MQQGIGGRIALIFSTLVLVATGTVGYMVYQGARTSLVDSSTERLAHTAAVVRVRMSAHVETVGKDVRFLASTPAVQGIVRARTLRGLDPETAIRYDEWEEQLEDIFRVFLQNRPSYTRASFVDLRAREEVLVNVEGLEDSLLTAVAPDPAATLRSFMPPPASVEEGEVYVSPVELIAVPERGDDVAALHAAVPVFSARGRLFGAVVISADLEQVLLTMASLAGPDKSLYLANEEGDLLKAAEGPFAAEGSQPGGIQSAFPGIDVQREGVHVIDKRHSEHLPAGIAYFERLSYGPREGEHFLTVGVASPQHTIFSAATVVRKRSILITLLFGLGGIILALGFSQYLTRPLQRVTQAISRFGEEEEIPRLPVERRDEIGVLARAFDTMASHMRYQMKVLEDKERRQGIILETAAEGIVVADARGVIEDFNSAAERLFDYTFEEVVDAHLSLLIPHYGRNGALSGNWNDVGTGREVLARRKDGSYMPVSLSVSTFEFSNEEKHAIFLEDITERKEYESALRSAKEHAEEMARLKSAFLANMSHEIRTPLTAVIGFASTLATEVAEEHRGFAHLIERSGRRLMTTLNAVLSLAQLEARQMKVELDMLVVADEAEDVVQLFEQQADAKNLTLDLRIDPSSADAQARLDRGAFGSIMQNLIGNAVKFTEEGEVAVTVEASDDLVSVQVRDTGIGIAEHFIPHLFDAFRQESSGLQRTHEGSGLGLSLTKRLVELMDGTIDVSSTKGEGSTFTIQFPRVEDALKREAPPPKESLLELAGDQRDGHVLLVEDNEDTAFLVGHLLEDFCGVTVALNAEEAVASAKETRYDLVLLDLNLGSGKTGVDVLETLRADSRYEGVPVIAVTAYALPGDRERFLSLGFDDYVSKPFEPDKLLDLVMELLSERSAKS